MHTTVYLKPQCDALTWSSIQSVLALPAPLLGIKRGELPLVAIDHPLENPFRGVWPWALPTLLPLQSHHSLRTARPSHRTALS